MGYKIGYLPAVYLGKQFHWIFPNLWNWQNTNQKNQRSQFILMKHFWNTSLSRTGTTALFINFQYTKNGIFYSKCEKMKLNRNFYFSVTMTKNSIFSKFPSWPSSRSRRKFKGQIVKWFSKEKQISKVWRWKGFN